MMKRRNEIKAKIKKIVEKDTVDKIVSEMLKNKKWIDWEPLAMLAACQHIQQKLYPKSLILNDGMKIIVTEENCWRKMNDICFSLMREGVFRDPTERDLFVKYPAVEIVWPRDGQKFIARDFVIFKDKKNAKRFLEAYQEIWQILAEGKDFGISRVSIVKTAIIETVKIE